MTMLRSVVVGCGSYLPAKVLTNSELAATVDTSDEWIVQRTGIHERRIAAPGELTSDLGLHAAKAALTHAKLDAQSIDLIILATSTPDNTFRLSCRNSMEPGQSRIVKLSSMNRVVAAFTSTLIWRARASAARLS